jgi:hypothetical protein
MERCGGKRSILGISQILSRSVIREEICIGISQILSRSVIREEICTWDLQNTNQKCHIGRDLHRDLRNTKQKCDLIEPWVRLKNRNTLRTGFLLNSTSNYKLSSYPIANTRSRLVLNTRPTLSAEKVLLDVVTLRRIVWSVQTKIP